MTTTENSAPILVFGKRDAERSRLIEILTQFGCEVLVAETIAEASLLCRPRVPALLFIDCQMPCVWAANILDDLRAEGISFAPSQVVAYTSGSVVSCLEAPCVMRTIIRKPVSRDAVLPLVENASGGGVAVEHGESQPAGKGVAGRPCPNAVAMQSLLRDFNPHTARKLARAFVDDGEFRLANIAEALATSTWETAMRQVHALKSGCLQIGAHAMVGACDALMSSLKAENKALASDRFGVLRTVFDDERASLE